MIEVQSAGDSQMLAYFYRSCWIAKSSSEIQSPPNLRLTFNSAV